MKIKQFIDVFEQYFPTSLAYDWDNVGLQVGTFNREVTSVLLTLDVTMEVIEEAIQQGSNLIIAHHPLLFRPVQQLSMDTYLGQMIERCVKHDITVYAAHTNFDISNVGLNVILADLLQLQNHRPLEMTTETEGLGRIGSLSTKITLEEFIQTLKQLFELKMVNVIGDIKKTIQTIALCGGSGSSLINAALNNSADVYISGDITYHHALDAKNLGLTILDIGHNIEKFTLPALQQLLSENIKGVTITVSTIDTNPYLKA